MNFVKEFLSEVSFTGCKEIVFKGRSLGERLFWTTCVLIGLVFSVLLVSASWLAYQNNPTTISIAKNLAKSCVVPAITICSTEFRFKKIDAKYYIKRSWGKLSERRHHYYMDFLYKVANLSYWHLDSFPRYMMDPTVPASQFADLQKQFRFKHSIGTSKSIQEIRNEYFNDTQTIVGEGGVCECYNCMYNDRSQQIEAMSETRDGTFLINCRIMLKWLVFGIKTPKSEIYVHAPNDIPNHMHPNYITKGKEIVNQNTKVSHTLTSDAVYDLTIKQRKCRFHYENNLTVTTWYRRSTCLMECRRDAAMKLCGCVPYVYTSKAEMPSCGVADFHCLIEHKRELMVYWSHENCFCDTDCGRVEFFPILYSISEPFEYGSVYSLGRELFTDFTYNNDVIYSKLDMLASWGGSVSFFLGGSLLSIVEFVYLLVRWPVFLFIDKSRKHGSNDKKVWRKPHTLKRFTGLLRTVKDRMIQTTFFSVFARVISDYTRMASVHGIKYIGKSSYSKIERLFWTALFIGFLVEACMVGYALLCTSSVIIYEEIVLQTSIAFSFPAIFVCPRFPFWNYTTQKIYGHDAMLFEAYCNYDLMFPTETFFISAGYFMKRCAECPFCNKGLREEYFENHKNCLNLIRKCSLNGYEFKCCEILQYFINECEPCFAFNTLQQPRNGSIDDSLEEILGIGKKFRYRLEMKFEVEYYYMTSGIDLCPRSSGVPCLCSRDFCADMGFGTSAFYVLRVTETTVDHDVLLLDAEYRGCRMPLELMPGSRHPIYDFTACLVECRTRLMLQICGCVHIYSPYRDNATVCDLQGILCLEKNKDILLNLEFSGKCNCLPNCKETYFDIIHVSSVADERNNFQLDFIASNKEIRVRLMRGNLESFVLVGGVVGLFLGPSVLSIVEFLFFFTVRFISYVLEAIQLHRPVAMQ